MRGLRRIGGAAGAVFSTAVVASMLTTSAAQASTSYVVDDTSASCSDAGAGTAVQPFCTIAAAASKAHAGDTVLVAAGTYSGTSVDPASSGVAGSPITFTANPGVTISGGTRAFSISSRNYIVVNGFNVTGTSSYGIYVSGGSNNIVSNNSVSLAGQPVSGAAAAGIYIRNLAGGTVSGNVSHDNSSHGIALSGSTTGVTVAGNTSYHNAYQYQRAAEGINDLGPGNSIIRNVTYGNEDTGINIYPGANNTLIADNVSYDNGDHGIDNHDVTGGRIIGNTVYDNCADGINVEGTSGNYDIENNVSSDNATGAIISPTPINPAGAYSNNCDRRTGNIGVYDSAPATTTANYNLVWQDGAGAEYEWSGTPYNTQPALNLATGQEANGIFANPKFANAAIWDLQLTAGSPAIDSANSGASGEQATDLLGNPRVDVPAMPNTGSGPQPYGDRGAYEFQPVAPVAHLKVSPATGATPLAVIADASPSAAGNAAITGYTFDFGDGSTVGPQAAARAAHTYTSAGTVTVKVTVTDSDGLTSTATQRVTVDWPVARYLGQIGTNHATTRHRSDSVTVSRARHVAAGRLIVVTVQLTGTKAGGAVTGKDSAGDLLRAVRSISNRAGDRLVVLSGVAKHGLATGSKITITFPSALTNLITADQVTGVTTVDRQSAAAGTRAAFSSGSTGTLSRPGEFVFAVTATFGRTSVRWAAGWKRLPTDTVGANASARAYRVPASTSSFAGTGTANARWLAEVVAFK
ncbi:MAG TPA: right-handed parallel beta-helix repeat-containing protein [Streptosporangiaceae bacterium]